MLTLRFTTHFACLALALLSTGFSECIETRKYYVDAGGCAVYCEGRNPVCDPAGERCVQCVRDTDCGGSEPFCSLETFTCTRCSSDADCAASASGAICDTASGACRPCREHAECSGQAGTPSCDLGSGRCVACTADTEVAACGEFSCSRAEHVCTGTKRGTLSDCRACQAESECRAGFACVVRMHEGMPHGSYCLPRRSTANCVSAGAHVIGPPYAYAIDATSVDGVATAVCSPRDSLSCEAIRASGDPCTPPAGDGPDDDACGDAALHDGVCVSVTGLGSHCKYTCADKVDCSTGTTCESPDDVGPRVCQ